MSHSIKEGQELYNTGRLHGQWPLSDLIEKIGSIQAFRDSLKPKLKKTRSILIGAIIGTVVFAILTFALSGSPVAIIGVLGLIAGIIIIVTSIIRLIRLNRDNFDSDATTIMGPLFRCIAPDLAKNVPVTVNASLKSPFAKDFLVKEGQKYSTFAYPECVDRFYKRQILSLECRLLDGTRMLAGVVENSIEKTLKKKNPRGKWKTKRKYRRKLGIKVRFQLDNTRSRLTGQLKLPAKATVRVRQSARGDVISLSLAETFKGSGAINASSLLSLMAGAYGAVAPVPNNQAQTGGGI